MDKSAERVYRVDFQDFSYAVREDDILNLFVPMEILLLPSEAEDRDIYVTSLVDDLYYLYDITPFLGGGTGDFESARQVLIISETDKINGFFLNHICDEPRVPDGLYPLPEYLKSPLLDSAVVIEGKPLPLLNIRELQRRMQETETPSVEISFKIESGERKDVAHAESFIRYRWGSRDFSIPGFLLPEKEIIEDDPVQVSFYPEQVLGIAFHEDEIVPVIRIFTDREDGEGGKCFAVARLEGALLGFCADSCGGEIDLSQTHIRELPPLARKRGWTHALANEGELSPLVNLYGIVEDIETGKEADDFLRGYLPGSGFSSVFLRDIVELMEFEFGGSAYGLPREEVIECVSFLEYGSFPGLPPMIPGILHYKDELLPVLDLALWSGVKSYSAGYRDMVLFQNGNLRLAIAVEKLLDWKRVDPGGQREFRHRFLYGCYYDDMLKLILNIFAMLKYYDEVRFTLLGLQEAVGEDAFLPEEEEYDEAPLPGKPVEPTEEDLREKDEAPVGEDHLKGEETGSLQGEKEGDTGIGVREEIVYPPDKDDREETQKRGDTPEFREPLKEKKGNVPGTGGGGEADKVPEEKPVEERDKIPLSETVAPSVKRESDEAIKEETATKVTPPREGMISTPEKSEAVDGREGTPGEKRVSAAVNKTSSPEKTGKEGEPGRRKKALFALVPAVLLFLLFGLIYTFFFTGDGDRSLAPGDLVREETKERREETLPDEKAVRDEAGEKRESVKEASGSGREKPERTSSGRSSLILFEDEKRIVFRNLLFPADSDELLPAETRKLEGIASLLRSRRGKKIVVTGYTARFGTEAGRKFLSRERAAVVGEYLVSAGACSREELSYRAMGAARPVGDDRSLAGRRKTGGLRLFS